jgi:hypothetical protein
MAVRYLGQQTAKDLNHAVQRLRIGLVVSLDDYRRPCGFGLAFVSDLLTTRALIGHPRETFKIAF